MRERRGEHASLSDGFDVLFETCSGGAGGAVAVAVGDAQIRELHDAVAEAARASVAGENLAENLAENPAGARR